MSNKIASAYLCCLMALVLAAGLGCWLTAHGAAAPVSPPVAAPQSTPTCTQHTTEMRAVAEPPTPRAGDLLTVSVTLTNAGCGSVGLPDYRLMIFSEQSIPIFTTPSPESIMHYRALYPGEADHVTFTLHAIGAGAVTITARSSFEVHLGYPGPAYWTGDVAPPLRLTVPPTDTEVVALLQTADALACPLQVRHSGATYHLDCPVAAGHAARVDVQRFETADAALDAFESARGDRPPESFHCFPAYAWERETIIMPQYERGLSWVADRWWITASAVDDTAYQIAPAPLEVSQALYRTAIQIAWFAGCDRLYLPTVLRS